MNSRNPQINRNLVFEHAITELLKKYQINVSPTEINGRDVFILAVGELDIHLIGSPQGYLSIACKAGRLPDDANLSVYISLLSSNIFRLEHPVLSVGVTAETREVILSTRQPLSELNSVDTFRLVESIIEQATALNKWTKTSFLNYPNPLAMHTPC